MTESPTFIYSPFELLVQLSGAVPVSPVPGRYVWEVETMSMAPFVQFSNRFEYAAQRSFV